MEKINLKTKKAIDLAVFEFDGNTIIVNPYITLGIRQIIVENYIHNLYDDVIDFSKNYFIAKVSMQMMLIDMCTNIEVDSDSFDYVLSSGLWDEIIKRISNYNTVLEDIYEVAKIYQEKKDLENVMAGLIGDLMKTFDSKEYKQAVDKTVKLDVLKDEKPKQKRTRAKKNVQQEK